MRRCLLPLLASTLCVAPLHAQSTVIVSPFVAVDRSLPGDPVLVGVSAAAHRGSLGVRASGSAALRGTQPRVVSPAFEADGTLLAYGADLDAVLLTGRRAGAAGSFGAVDPRVFAGVGLRGERFAGQGLETHPVVSFGSTLSYSVLSRLRAEAEVRRVVPFDRVGDLLDFSGGSGGSPGAWEYRVGFSLNFGSGALRPRAGLLESLAIPGLRPADAPRRVVDVAPGTVLATADQHVGIPYEWGGASPNPGFDCSGFVQYVFARHDVRLPRTSREQALVGNDIGRSIAGLQPGDLMFFDGKRDGRIDHVAVYAGNNIMIHASSSGRAVGYDDLTTQRGRWFQDIYVGGRRVLGVPIEGVMATGPAPGAAVPAGSRKPRPGIAAFLAAAGLSATDLSALARSLYSADEMIDGPDDAPARRW